jgi:hypothetical protein
MSSEITMRMIAVAAALVFTISAASAQPSVFVMGDVNCGKWIEGRTQRTALNLEGFVQGFLNGLAQGTGIEFWDVGGNRVSNSQVFLWMDNYCRTNPLSNVYAGATALINERTNGALDRYWRVRR